MAAMPEEEFQFSLFCSSFASSADYGVKYIFLRNKTMSVTKFFGFNTSC